MNIQEYNELFEQNADNKFIRLIIPSNPPLNLINRGFSDMTDIEIEQFRTYLRSVVNEILYKK